MKVIATKLNGVFIIEQEDFIDERGFFCESFHVQKYQKSGINLNVKQINHSYSKQNVLRGLHFQQKHPQSKLIQVLIGAIYDVCADINPHSATFGQYVGIKLSAENRRQLWISKGYAHGFYVISDFAYVQYACDEFYDPLDAKGIIWHDLTLNINWPGQKPVLSTQDQNLPNLKDYLFNTHNLLI